MPRPPAAAHFDGVLAQAHGPVPVRTAPYEGPRTTTGVPASDARWAHPGYTTVAYYPSARYWAPRYWYYRPWYAHWWCHPYYRWTWSTTVVVGLPFVAYAWVDTWAPPPRAGWVWVPGSWIGTWWSPGHWAPAAPAPVGYRYVPGAWYADAYVEGYYRSDARDGWTWIEGHYTPDGTHVPGHWMPTGAPPEGYVWEPGFFDGESWMDGFWRPEFRQDYVWVSSRFDRDGLYRAGYWQPVEDRPGQVWQPGWFDGNAWVEGSWVDEASVKDIDPTQWKPEDGWSGGAAPPPATPPPGRFEQAVAPERPLAIPVPLQ